jgi:acetylornithine deacetylase/succinyl-diaminopimelate desuccinylase-like protein
MTSAGLAALDVIDLARSLIRSPPGSERTCLEEVAALLDAAGLKTKWISDDEDHPNLLARLRGGDRSTLLMYGHVDVVPAAAEEWSHPPFVAEVADGCVWGRGALDMKGGVAMMIVTLLQLACAGRRPPGDILLVLTSDEETGSRHGMRLLVERHADEFAGVRHAIGEVGGTTMWLGKRRLFPIQVAEKQRCVIRATISGPGGHAAAGITGTAAGKLGRLLGALDDHRLPLHVVPANKIVLEALAKELPQHREMLLGVLDDPTAEVELPASTELADVLQPLLRNTATPTAVSGGVATNVVPTKLFVDLDGRVLPGQSPQALVSEVEELAPGLARYEITYAEPAAVPLMDLELLPLLSDVLARHDPEATAIPWMLPAYTDARYVSQLGIQTYGYLPMRLPPDVTLSLMHAPDERVPADALQFGVDCLTDLVRHYWDSAGTRT